MLRCVEGDFFILLRKGGDVVAGTLGQGATNSKAELYGAVANVRTPDDKIQRS